jgi:hypothetical protein
VNKSIFDLLKDWKIMRNSLWIYYYRVIWVFQESDYIFINSFDPWSFFSSPPGKQSILFNNTFRNWLMKGEFRVSERLYREGDALLT